MPIPLDPPLTIPAIPERTFDASWVRNFRVQTSKPNEGTLVIETVPHNTATGETLDAPAQVYQTDLWEVAANVPAAGIALQAVLAAVPDIIAYIVPDQATARKPL